MTQHIGIVGMSDANSPLATLDSTRLLARAALQRAVGAVGAG